MITVDDLNQRGVGRLPGHLRLVITHCSADELRAELPVRSELMAPNGFLHAGAVVRLADTLCGYGCVVNLPVGATGFTTLELKPTTWVLRARARSTPWRGRYTAAARPRCGTPPSATATAARPWPCFAAPRCCCTRQRRAERSRLT